MTDMNKTTDESESRRRSTERVLSLAGVAGPLGAWLWADQGELAVAAVLLAAGVVAGFAVVRYQDEIRVGSTVSKRLGDIEPPTAVQVATIGFIVVVAASMLVPFMIAGPAPADHDGIAQAAAGDTEWSTTGYDGGSWFNQRADPLVVGDTMYFAISDEIYAFNRTTGNVKWSVGGLPSGLEGPVGYDPDNKYVYAGGATSVVAVDTESQTKAWEVTGLPDADFQVSREASGPTVGPDNVYYGSGAFHALDKKTGDFVWNNTSPNAISGSALVDDGTVYIGDNANSGDGYLYALDTSDGSEKWKNGVEYGYQTTPTLDNGYIYVPADNQFRKIDASTGNTEWSVSNEGTYGGEGSGTVDGNTFYATDDNNLVALDTSDGSLRWSKNYGSEPISSPTVANGNVYVGDGSASQTYYAYDSSGTQLWSYGVSGNAFGSPLVVDGTVYAHTVEPNVYAIETSHSATSSGSRTEDQSMGFYIDEPPDTYPVDGTVSDADGNGISGVTVEAVNTTTDSVADSATTNSSGDYRLSLPAGEYEINATKGSDTTIKTVDVPSGGTTVDFCLGDCSDSGYEQPFELLDHTGNFPDPTLTVDKPDLDEIQGSKVPSSSGQWQTVEQTSFNHNDRAYVDLETDEYYRLTLRDGQSSYSRAGFQGDETRGTEVIEIGQNKTTPTPTPFNTTRPNVTVIPYEGGIRVTYDGEPLESFEYEVEGPNGSVYNVSRDFEAPTDYFQSDLDDSVTDNASEDSERYTIDYNATTTDGEAFGGELDAGENTGLSFGGSTGSSGGGGGIVADDAGSNAPLAVTAVPAVAAVGYALYRRRRSSV